MDFEQASIRLPTLTEFNNKLKQIIDDKVKKSGLKFMECIAEGENMSLDYLKTKYGGEHISPLTPLSLGLQGSEALLLESLKDMESL